ncbi:MAG: hypothetical protein J6O43_05505 [Clostridium sp.]|nr:hypothetical protein [Clostridium sp.]
MKEKNDDYQDIIHLPHHVSVRHPQMPVGDRAAQFMPFAALTGYGEAVRKTAEKTEHQVEAEIQRIQDPETML